MKKAIVKIVLPLSAIAICSGNAYAVRIGTQDLIIFDKVRIESDGEKINLSPEIISTALGSPGSSVIFPGGATFTSTTALESLAASQNLTLLGNTTVTPGVLSFGGEQFFSVLTTSNLDSRPRSIGISDLIQTDLSSIFPTSVEVGDVGRFNNTFIQFTMPSSPASEAGLLPLEIAASRANAGLVQFPSIDGSTLAEVFNQPYIVGEGSRGLRYFGKGLGIVGATTGGGLVGAGVGSAVPAIGTVAGGVVGAIGGFTGSLGGAIERNKQGAPQNPRNPPRNLIPRQGRVVPEPSSVLGVLAFGAFGAGTLLRRELKKRKSTTFSKSNV